jgi:MFS transporter, putative metabolite:H+ symporter
LVLGDIASGLLSQWLKSRIKVMYWFVFFSFIMTVIYLNSTQLSTTAFYFICFLMGASVGYWVLFVTISAEQFGTNIRATVTTTAPNFVRGSLPLIIFVYSYFRDSFFDGNILYAALVVSLILSALAVLALSQLKETFSVDLDYVE